MEQLYGNSLVPMPPQSPQQPHDHQQHPNHASHHPHHHHHLLQVGGSTRSSISSYSDGLGA
ncbi:hypothetical protein ZHAS_00005972 [Anopheles sinensis]|uniref:Uncharacterized protein n=1 Tax=Anopheles sinensis TaxID=74873 RepID=A0A084VKV2_ANOSI|nr:hypothetical protein ZHAS_00005972 [Anopheles sinensis]